jgi:predicted hydrolase (HD superfamily)
MEIGAQEFGVELWEHVDNMIKAMRPIAPTLGLAGNLNPDSSPV